MRFSCIAATRRSCNGLKRSLDVIEAAPPIVLTCGFTFAAIARLAVTALLNDSAECLILRRPSMACRHAESQWAIRHPQPHLSKAVNFQAIASKLPVNRGG